MKLERVVIADDNRIFRAVFREVFEELGAEVFEAEDGEAALQLTLSRSPQLVVLDLLMPHRHGFEVADAIAGSDLEPKPRIFLTTGVYKGTRWKQQGLVEHNADEFLTKPIDTGLLVERLGRYFEMDSDFARAVLGPA
jgi:CheY-like chemotaxis protein